MFLVARAITKSYNEQPVLLPLDLTIEAGERLAIIGETGSGKTTLLKCLSGLLDLNDGQILYQGVRVKGPQEVLLPGHPGISYLSQSVDLRSHYRVEDLLERHSILAPEQDRNLADLCRIGDLLHRMTDQLSGGERQRVALAIELSKHPQLLLLDEPFSNLDIGHRNILLEVLDDLHQHQGLTMVIVSHNPAEILGWADRMLVMQKGECLQIGRSEEIYENPKNEYIARLLGPYNLMKLGEGGGSVIVRPERLQIVDRNSTPLTGVIKKKQFEGHGVLYTVQCNDVSYLVKDFNLGRTIGQEVGIFVDINPST